MPWVSSPFLGVAWSVVLFAAVIALSSGHASARRVLASDDVLLELEQRAARAPSADTVSRLAEHHLASGRPGFALAAIDAAPLPLREAPQVGFGRARALLLLGRARAAVRAIDGAASRCDEVPTEASPGCPPWLLARAMADRAFAAELVALGFDDWALDTAVARQALERSRRTVGVVALR
jgi:hypothetical protein